MKRKVDVVVDSESWAPKSVPERTAPRARSSPGIGDSRDL